MVPKDVAWYLFVVGESIGDILWEARRMYESDPKNGLNLKLLKDDSASRLISEIEKHVYEYIKNNDTFSPKEYAKINKRVSELLTTLKRMVEMEINCIKEVEDEEMLREEGVKDYRYL